ncbi:hypothetical protein CEY07_13000 [Bacillus safensis]|nr:hypothetical protein CEY07_13000 [Bacillus safensis]
MLVLPRLQRFSITLKRRQRAKIKIILALCQQSELFSNKEKSFFLLKAACYNVVQYEAKGSGAENERDRT